MSNDGLIIENMDLWKYGSVFFQLYIPNFVSLPLKFDNPYYHTVNINDIDSHLLQAAHQYKGQAHDTFSRTFQIRIYQYFLPNIVWFVCLDFLKCSNLREIALYWPIKKNVFFYLLRNIGEKICRFIFGKFVKTFRELDNSEESFSNLWETFVWDPT
mgnify:CR=1 FL=1